MDCLPVLSLAESRHAFNEHRDSARVVTLLSPT